MNKDKQARNSTCLAGLDGVSLGVTSPRLQVLVLHHWDGSWQVDLGISKFCYYKETLDVLAL